MLKNTYSNSLKILSLTILFFVITHSVTHFSLFAQINPSKDIIEEFVNGNRTDIQIGFREQSAPISFEGPNSTSSNRTYEGFCNVFADQLLVELKNHVKNRLIEKNPNHHSPEIDKRVKLIKHTKHNVINLVQGKRFQGLEKDPKDVDHIDVECGANSIQFKENIAFSDPFFKTGISLLAKQDIVDRILKNRANIKSLKIGVL
jgi:hypothetical protein